MLPGNSRGVRWTVAPMLPALAACADDPTPTGPLRAHTPLVAVEDPSDALVVTNASGGSDFGSLRWAAGQVSFRAIIRFDPRLAGDTIVVDASVHAAHSVPGASARLRTSGTSASGAARVRYRSSAA